MLSELDRQARGYGGRCITQETLEALINMCRHEHAPSNCHGCAVIRTEGFNEGWADGRGQQAPFSKRELERALKSIGLLPVGVSPQTGANWLWAELFEDDDDG